MLKVIVDGLPQSCCECPLMGKNEDLGYCIAGEELEPEYPYRRPDWCPLMREGEVFDWIMKRDVTPYVLNGMKESEE